MNPRNTRPHELARPMFGNGLVRALAVVVTGWVLVVALAPSASAHAFLLFSDPAFDGAVSESPRTVNLVFSEPVDAGSARVSVVDTRGREVGIDRAIGAEGGTILSSAIDEDLDEGIYEVRWEVDGDDGHGAAGSYRFAVGTALVANASAPDVASTDWGSAGRRWLLVTGFAIALGGLVGERLTSVSRDRHANLPEIRSWSGVGIVVGAVSVVASAVVLVVDRASISALLAGPPGWRILAEFGGFAAAWILIRAGRPRVAVVALVVVAGAEGVDSHSDLALPVLGLILTGIHLIAGAVWFGALLHVVRAAYRWRGIPGLPREIWTAYARLAAKLFVVVVVSGSAMAALLVPFSSLTSTDYGRALLLKVVLVAAVAALAIVGRRALRRAPGRSVRLARTEVGGLAMVLVLAALLVSTATPGSVVAAPPPPPVGVPVPAGGLAGQVGVNVVASEGQLVVRLSSPQAGNAYSPDNSTDFSLAGQVASDGRQSDLDFRSCGEGCFVAPHGWSDGDNILSLRADASGWKGGALSSLIAWPGTPAEDLLERTTRAMSEVERLTIDETGTSDGSSPLPPPYRVSISGDDYVASAPFGSGVAPVVVSVPAVAGTTRLLVGLPSSGVFVNMTVNSDGRIVEEVTASPKHVFRRRFVYSRP